MQSIISYHSISFPHHGWSLKFLPLCCSRFSFTSKKALKLCGGFVNKKPLVNTLVISTFCRKNIHFWLSLVIICFCFVDAMKCKNKSPFFAQCFILVRGTVNLKPNLRWEYILQIGLASPPTAKFLGSRRKLDNVGRTCEFRIEPETLKQRAGLATPWKKEKNPL